MVLNYTFMYQGYKTSYKTEILSRDQKKSILLMLLFLGLPSPSPPPSPPPPPASLRLALLLYLLALCTFFRFLAPETSFYLKGQFFQRGTEQN